MTSPVTVNLPDDLYHKAQVWANHSGRSLELFLADAIEMSLLPFDSVAATMRTWSDQQVTQAMNQLMPDPDDRRISDLLRRQSESEISPTQARELQDRMSDYQRQLLIKSTAIREAVRRKLADPPAS